MTKLISFVLKTTFIDKGGYGNGYVAIPKDHPCFEMDYSQIHNRYTSIRVNGGLTFAGSTIIGQPKETKGMWIVGFDTLHYWDTLERWPNEEVVLLEANKLKQQLELISKRAKRKLLTSK